MTKQETDQHENSEQEYNVDTFICEKCETETAFLYDRGKAGWYRCPSCGAGIRKKDVPEDFPIKPLVGTNRSKKNKTPPVVIDEDYEPEDEEDEEEYYTEPLEDWEVLRKVLNMPRPFKPKPQLAKYLINRCKIRCKGPAGGMTPQELENEMARMPNIGLNKKAIGLVVEDYYYALQKEQEKRRANFQAPGFSRMEEPETSSNPFRSTRRRRRDVPVWQQDAEDRLSREDLERMWNDKEEKREMREEINNLRQVIMNMEGQKQSEEQNTMFALLMKQQEESARQQRELLLEMQKSREQSAKDREALLLSMQQQRDEQANKIIELYKEQANRVPLQNSSDKYSNDTIRLMADGLNSFTSVINNKKPVKEVMEVAKSMNMQQMIQQQEQQAPLNVAPVAEGEEFGILSEIPEHLVSEE